MFRANPFRLRFATGMFCKNSSKYAKNVFFKKLFVGLHGDKTHNTFFCGNTTIYYCKTFDPSGSPDLHPCDEDIIIINHQVLTDEDPGLRIESFAVIKIYVVFTLYFHKQKVL